MNLETRIPSRDKDNQIGSFHDCQCLRAKGTIGYHLTSSLSFHNVLISDTLQGSMGPYDRMTVTTVLGEHSRPQVSTRGQKEGPHEHKKMTREQKTKSLGLAYKTVSKELFKRTLPCNIPRLLLLTRYQKEAATVEKEN